MGVELPKEIVIEAQVRVRVSGHNFVGIQPFCFAGTFQRRNNVAQLWYVINARFRAGMAFALQVAELGV